MWPENLECSKFPEEGTEEICISPNVSSSSSSSSPSLKNEQNSFSTPISTLQKHDRKTTNGIVDFKTNTTGYSHRSIGFICPAQLKSPVVMGYSLNVGGKVVKDCGKDCSSLFFDENERTFLRYWISSWAAVTIACSLFTVS